MAVGGFRDASLRAIVSLLGWRRRLCGFRIHLDGRLVEQRARVRRIVHPNAIDRRQAFARLEFPFVAKRAVVSSGPVVAAVIRVKADLIDVESLGDGFSDSDRHRLGQG